MTESLNEAKVPKQLAALIPFAQKWGISDDGLRVQAVENASNDELRELSNSLDLVDQAVLWKWLEGGKMSKEYIAITCLTMAVDSARQILELRRR